jgi:hypothetical protein
MQRIILNTAGASMQTAVRHPALLEINQIKPREFKNDNIDERSNDLLCV